MALKAPATANTNKTFTAQPNLEPGSYPARVVRVYGLGTHPQSYMGEVKAPKFMLTVVYELCDAFMVDDNGDEMEDKPRWVMEKFPLNPMNSENAKSTKRYLAIDPQKEHDGDWAALIGAPVSVTIVNNPAADGRIFDNVGNTTVLRARDAAKLPDLANEGFFFDPSEPNIEYYNKIPKFIQDDIKKAIDYAGGPLETLLEGAPVEPVKAAKPKPARKSAAVDPDDAPDVGVDADQNPWD